VRSDDICFISILFPQTSCWDARVRDFRRLCHYLSASPSPQRFHLISTNLALCEHGCAPVVLSRLYYKSYRLISHLPFLQPFHRFDSDSGMYQSPDGFFTPDNISSWTVRSTRFYFICLATHLISTKCASELPLFYAMT
jgi:hypothetical protein